MGVSVSKISELNSYIKLLKEIKNDKEKCRNYPKALLGIFELEKPCEDYDAIIKKIHANKKKYADENGVYIISKFNLTQVNAYLTRIANGEKYASGFISTYIESGLLLELVERLKEIYVNRNTIERKLKGKKTPTSKPKTKTKK